MEGNKISRLEYRFGPRRGDRGYITFAGTLEEMVKKRHELYRPVPCWEAVGGGEMEKWPPALDGVRLHERSLKNHQVSFWDFWPSMAEIKSLSK
jgi:hypothetical protein